MNQKTLRTLRAFIAKELTQSLRDPRMRIILFVLPMMQMMVFGLAVSSEVKNVRIAAVFPPKDTITREVFDRAISSGWFIPANVKGEDPFQWVQANQADAVLVAPAEGVTNALNRGVGQLQLLVDATNVIRAQAVENYIHAIVNQVTRIETGNSPPLSLDVRILYNPSMQSAVFMVPGVMSLILCVITILLTSMSMAREKEMGTFEMIISTPVKTWEILLGKTVPFILLGMADIPLILGLAVFVFKVPMVGSLWALGLAGFVFVCTTVSIGTLISTFADNQQQAMMGGFIFLFVATLLSGLMFPLENMPIPMRALTYINPLAYFITLLRNIMLKGGDASVIWSNLAALTLMAAISIWIAFKRFKPTLPQ